MIGHMKNNSRLNVLSRFIMFTVFLPFPLASFKVLSPEDHLILLFILISGHRHWSFGGGGTWKDLREILSPSSLALALCRFLIFKSQQEGEKCVWATGYPYWGTRYHQHQLSLWLTLMSICQSETKFPLLLSQQETMSFLFLATHWWQLTSDFYMHFYNTPFCFFLNW